MSNFVAIDFETATFGRASACAIGMVHVQDQQIGNYGDRYLIYSDRKYKGQN